MLTPTTSGITPEIAALASELAPGMRPVFVVVQPAADGEPNECFASVDSYIDAFGGSRILGWALWLWPKLMIEAEFGAVWEGPDGAFKDVTPRLDRESKILFLPDPHREYDGRQVNNVRRALTPDADVSKFIALSDEIFTVLNSGARAQAKSVTVPKHEILPLLTRKAELLGGLWAQMTGRSDSCPCGSTRKFKRCHGANAD